MNAPAPLTNTLEELPEIDVLTTDGKGTAAEPLRLSLRQIDALIHKHIAENEEFDVPKYTLYYQCIMPHWFDLLPKHPQVTRATTHNKRDYTEACIEHRNMAHSYGTPPLFREELKAKTPALALCLCLLKFHGFFVEALP